MKGALTFIEDDSSTSGMSMDLTGGLAYVGALHLLIYLLLWQFQDASGGFLSPKFQVGSTACRVQILNDVTGDGGYHDVADVPRMKDRRDFISMAVSTNMVLILTKSMGEADAAEDPGSMLATPPKPFAPLEALLPAALQRNLLKSALQLSKAGQSASTEEIVQNLQEILEPPSATSTPQRRAISMTRRYILDQKQLMTHPISRLSGRTFRAAMNVYTSNLRFGESYLWNAPRSETKRWIRENGQLPSVQQVITADLDLRDLYRNQVQTRIEDAQAELYNQSQSVDFEELTSLLSEATDACDKWFQLISVDDLLQADVKLQELLGRGQADAVLVRELPKQKFDGYNFFTDD